jgi:hypothetical protein
VPLYPLTPAVFVVVSGYLLYSSVMYATSQNAIHVSMVVMAVGAVAWFVTRIAAGPALR